MGQPKAKGKGKEKRKVKDKKVLIMLINIHGQPWHSTIFSAAIANYGLQCIKEILYSKHIECVSKQG